MRKRAEKQWARSSVRALIAIVIVCGVLPFVVAAQETNQAQTELHASIRVDLMADPRSSSLSESELNALVQSIAEAFLAQGNAGEYLEGRNTIDYSEAFAAALTPQPVSGMPTPAVLWAAFLLVIGLILLIVWRARGPRTISEDPVATA